MNNKVDRFQFLVNGKNKNIINKVKIRILIESLKVRRICDSQPTRGECVAPAVKIPYRRPCSDYLHFPPNQIQLVNVYMTATVRRSFSVKTPARLHTCIDSLRLGTGLCNIAVHGL